MPSWTSSSQQQAIWYVSQFKKWAIGPLDSVGTTHRGISSRYPDASGLPFNIEYWDYGLGLNWMAAGLNDIIVECIDVGEKLF